VSLTATCCCSTGNSDTYTCQYALRELSRTHAHAHIHTRSVPSVLLSVPVQEVVCDSNEVDTVDVGTWRLFPRHIAPIQTHTLWSKWIKLKMLDLWKEHTHSLFRCILYNSRYAIYASAVVTLLCKMTPKMQENSNSPTNHYPCFRWAFILLSFPSHKGNKWKSPSTVMYSRMIAEGSCHVTLKTGVMAAKNFALPVH